MPSIVGEPSTLSAHEYPIYQIFSDGFLFTIPDYQRPYSWTTEHAELLLEDLLDAVSINSGDVDDLNPYFLGSVVLIKGQTAPSEVVDGQQRLTTLTILISALRDLAVEDKKDFLSQLLYQQGSPFVGTEDTFRLTLRQRDAEFFRNFIQRKDKFGELEAYSDSITDPQTRIRENALFFRKRLSELDEEQLTRLTQFILKRSYLVAVSTPDLDSAYRIFSVLNDRGLELSAADILKAETIGSLPDSSREAYSDKWEQIEEQLGQSSFQALFGHIRMIFRKAKAQGTLLQEFREYVKPKDSPESFVDNTLAPLSRAYEEITGGCFEGTQQVDEINTVARYLGFLDNADWIAPAIFFIKKHRNDPDLLNRLLVDLERLAAGTMVIRTNFNHRMERYGRLLRAADKDEDLFSPDSPLQLTDAEREKAIEVLNGDIYNSRIRVPLLLRLDSIASANEGAVYEHKIISVEHVLPQNPTPESEWMNLFPDEIERYDYTHCLGNLVLLSRRKNSKAQNYEFEKKKTQYFQQNGTTPFALTSYVLSTPEWTPETIDDRQDMLIGQLCEAWRL